MLLHIIARGKIGRSPEANLVDRYMKRVAWPHKISELPDTGGKVPATVTPGVTVMLDETGEQLSSMALARRLERWRDDGMREARFLIGAADGFDDMGPQQLRRARDAAAGAGARGGGEPGGAALQQSNHPPTTTKINRTTPHLR